MPSSFASSPLPLIAAAAALLAVGFALGGYLTRRSPVRRTIGVLGTVVLVLLAALAGTLSVATQGYRALTREEVAATVKVTPTAPSHFRATFRYADGRTDTFDLRGDQLYVDAHILKWKPFANLLGLHTAYELDRVAGRYHDFAAERDSARTVYPLKAEKPLDLFTLRQKWAFLEPVVDTDFGSGTFQDVDTPAMFEVRVSTSGLLIRRLGQQIGT
jgi:hypothetical protein